MQLLNETPFPAATMIWENAAGAFHLTAVVKISFNLPKRGSRPDIAENQSALARCDEYFEGTPAAVRIESDRVPFKPLADVVLVGSAVAPRGQAVTQLDVSLRVGELRRPLRVFGDRAWDFPSRLAMVPRMSEPKPFTSMPLTYERAFGGIDFGGYWAENLTGRGYISRRTPESIHGKPLPNIEDPNNPIRFWDSRPAPAGFGFYGRGWQPRLGFAGNSGERDAKRGAPKAPADFSPRFYNGAHPDLQVPGYLRGDEEVELINIGPEPEVRFRLPGLRPTVTVCEYAVPPEKWVEAQAAAGRAGTIKDVPIKKRSLKMELDTLVLMPDERLFYEVFRGNCPLTDPSAANMSRIEVSA